MSNFVAENGSLQLGLDIFPTVGFYPYETVMVENPFLSFSRMKVIYRGDSIHDNKMTFKLKNGLWVYVGDGRVMFSFSIRPRKGVL